MSRIVLHIVPSAAALLLASVAAVCDLRTRRIPNRLVLLALGVALISSLAASSWRGLGGAAIAAMIATLLMSAGFFLGGIGAGDVKLMGTMGAFAGLQALPLLLLATAIAGGVFALLAIARSAYAARSFRYRQYDTETRPLTLPYALPIACGVCVVFCHALRSVA
jgi:prepilin peptidase CpaA